MSFGIGIGDVVTIAQVSKLAWQTFTAIKNAPQEWRALESEVQSLAISLRSLDDADTTLSIVEYTKNNIQREQNLKELLTNSNNALAPMKALIEKYRVKDIDEKRDIRDWLAGTRFTFKTMSVQEFRNKLSLHTASLNIFLTTLTNTSLGRLERLLMSSQGPLHPGLNLAAENTVQNHIANDGFDGIWSAIGRDLALGNGDKKSTANEVLDHKEEIRDYVQFITSGGLPYSKQELTDRRRIRPPRSRYSSTTPTPRIAEAVTYSLQIPIDDLTTTSDEDDLKALVDAMVSFNGERDDFNGTRQEEEESFGSTASHNTSPVVQAHTETSRPPTINSPNKPYKGTASSTSSSQLQVKSDIRCDSCKRELLPGEMYLHCKICQLPKKQKGFDVCDSCWENGKSCPGKHRDERYFNHRERRIAAGPV